MRTVIHALEKAALKQDAYHLKPSPNTHSANQILLPSSDPPSTTALVHLKIQTPMPFTPRIEPAFTLCTFTPTLQVLPNGQHMSASSTQYRPLISPIFGPYIRWVILACIMAADACVEFVATEVLDRYYVERRVPVDALRQERE